MEPSPRSSRGTCGRETSSSPTLRTRRPSGSRRPAGDRRASTGSSERNYGSAPPRALRHHQGLPHGRPGGPRPARPELVRGARLVPGHHGSLRIRQIEPHEHRGLPRPADLGPLSPPGTGGLALEPRCAGRDPQPDPGICISELQPPRPYQRPGERGAAAPLLGGLHAGAPPSGGGGAPAGGAGGSPRPPSQPALGRAGAARGDRPCAGHRAPDHPGRRAHGEPRLCDQRRGHGPLRGSEEGRDHHHPGDARARHRPVRGAGHHHEGRTPPVGPAKRLRPGRARRPGSGGHPMSLLQTLRAAVRALLRNKLRSFLTALGIIIGVAAVIAMVAIGEGAKARVEASFESMGADLLIVLPGTTTAGGSHGGFGTLPTLTWEDMKAIQTEAPAVREAAVVLRATSQVQSEEQNWTTSVNGTSPEYFEIRRWLMAEGARFTQADVDGSAKVALLGQTVVDRLFGSGVDPVGRSVRIKNVPFQVLGVLERKGQSPMGYEYDDAVYIPQTTFQTRIQAGLQKYIPGMILVSAASSTDAPRAQAQMASILRDLHHVQPGMADDFSIRNLSEMASAQEEG